MYLKNEHIVKLDTKGECLGNIYLFNFTYYRVISRPYKAPIKTSVSTKRTLEHTCLLMGVAVRG